MFSHELRQFCGTNRQDVRTFLERSRTLAAAGTHLPGWGVFLLVALAGGCAGRGDAPETAEVTGTVTLDGAPLEEASIIFQPEDGRPSYAVTDARGQYALMYTRDVPGAKLGNHSVHITTARGEDDPESEVPERLPAKYHSQSSLTANVEPGQNSIDFELSAD